MHINAANFESSQEYDDLEHVRQHGTFPDKRLTDAVI